MKKTHLSKRNRKKFSVKNVGVKGRDVQIKTIVWAWAQEEIELGKKPASYPPTSSESDGVFVGAVNMFVKVRESADVL